MAETIGVSRVGRHIPLAKLEAWLLPDRFTAILSVNLSDKLSGNLSGKVSGNLSHKVNYNTTHKASHYAMRKGEAS